MIRFIIKNRMVIMAQPKNAPEFNRLFTIVADVPELEKVLNAGGHGADNYELNELIGVELFTPCGEIK